MKTEEFGWKNQRLALFLLPLLFAAPLFAQDYSQGGQPDAQQDVQTSQDNPPGRVARLTEISGNVSLQPSGETDWTAATQNYTVSTGDRLYTDNGSRVALEIGPFAVRMSELTDLTVVNLNDQLAQFGIAQGTAQITVFHLPEGNTVELDTPNGALTLQSPGTYRADADPTNGYTVVSVYRGSLLVSGGDVSQTVGAGQAVRLTGSDQIQVTNASLPSPDDFESWVESRDKRILSAHTAEHVSPYMPGAADLDAYGQWQTGPDGPVWYPSGVAVGWVPYRVGRWAWIEPWGWTWVEAEPWGFAPFHYGRWAFYGGRWGWLPGPVIVAPIYSPALVAFVGGPGFSVGFGAGAGGFGLSAWFPLGPGEPFIPWYHSSPTYIREVNVTNVRNVTNITNINIINVQNIHYAYRTTAVTAVNAETFRSGQPVQHATVRVTPAQLATAQVVAHPSINPVKTAIVAHPVPAPRVAAVRPTTLPGAPHANQPPSTARSSRPAFVTKNPPPPPKPPFEARQPAMAAHPGSALDQRQLENLRIGKPAGAPREAVPPASSAPQEHAMAPAQHAAPSSHATPPQPTPAPERSATPERSAPPQRAQPPERVASPERPATPEQHPAPGRATPPSGQQGAPPSHPTPPPAHATPPPQHTPPPERPATPEQHPAPGRATPPSGQQGAPPSHPTPPPAHATPPPQHTPPPEHAAPPQKQEEPPSRATPESKDDKKPQ